MIFFSVGNKWAEVRDESGESSRSALREVGLSYSAKVEVLCLQLQTG